MSYIVGKEGVNSRLQINNKIIAVVRYYKLRDKVEHLASYSNFISTNASALQMAGIDDDSFKEKIRK